MEEIQERERFEVTDLSSLGWTLRKIAELQAQQKEITDYAKTEMERVKEWEKTESGKFQNDIDYFSGLVQHYHFHRLMEDPKAKTISTPYGKSKSTTTKPAPKNVDDTALLQHLKVNEFADYIKTEEKVKWGDLKKKLKIVETEVGSIVVDENGEQVPGVIVLPENTKFSVEVAE